jgi:hypothetical protein
VLLVAVGLPLAVTAVGLALVIAWLPQLPDPVAVHWGTTGADGFAPAWAWVLGYAVLGIGVPVLFGALSFAGSRVGPTWAQKLLTSASLGVTVVLAVTFVGTTAVQRGLEDAADAPDVGWIVVAALAAGLVAGAIGWFVQPPLIPAANELIAAEPLPLGRGERAVWLATTQAAPGVLLTIIVAIVLVLGCATLLVVQTGGESWFLFFAPVALVLLALSTTRWRVRVDETGLLVQSVLGRPRYRVPVAEIARAGAVEVSPTADFGGWGVRHGEGRRLGVITRGGPALEAVRHDGSSIVVTVDDAETGASLLSAYIAASADRPE